MTNQIARHLSFLAPAAVMSAWATVMLHTFATGHLNRLLSPMFRDYVLVAAIALLLLSALYVFLYQPTAQTAPTLAPMGRLRQFGRWLVLLVPLVAASMLAPDALSSTTLNNRAALDSTAGVTPMPSWNAASQDSAKKALDADPNQPVPVEVTDLITLAKSPEQMKAFDGRKVRVVGLMVAPAGSAPLWAGLAGAAASLAFILNLGLPALFAPSEVARTSGFMFTIGYGAAFFGPELKFKSETR